MKKQWLVLLLFVLALLPWVVRSGSYFYNIDAIYSDLTVSHLPNAIYLMDAIKHSGMVPYWSNLIMSGAPFAGDPLAGLWYPPGWIAYFLPQPFGFNLTALFHILWGGLGMVCLLSMLGLRREAAVIGGLAFLLMPKLFSHLAAGHVTLVYAVTWIPWLFLADLRKGQGGSGKSLYRIAPGLVLGVIFLADPRWAVYAGIAWLAFSMVRTAQEEQVGSFGFKIKHWLPGFFLQALTAFLISSVLLFPMLEFTRLSTRSGMTAADVLAFSLPPTQLVGMLLPHIGGYWEWQVYPGAIILLLVIYGLFIPKVRKKAGFWLVMILLAAIISLGSLWPFAENLAKLPLVSLVRVPSRAWFLTGIGLIVAAAYTLDAILRFPAEKPKPDPMVVLLPLASLAIFLTLGLWIIGQTPPLGFIWGAVALTAAVMLLMLLRQRNSGKGIMTGLIIMLVIDLGGVNWLGMNFRPSHEVNNEGREAAQFLASQKGEFRVYSPSNSIPQHTAAANELELIHGINPLQLQSYSDFMAQASGTNSAGYSVTIPNFATGEPEKDNIKARIDTGMLGLLNGKYIVSAFEMDHPRLVEIWHEGSSWIYENLDALPRAWVQDVNAQPGKGLMGEVLIDRQQADLVIAQASGPGLMVFSVPDYPGWEVSVDGMKAEKLRIANLLIGVELESGAHQINLTYRPKTVYWGQAISLITWLVIIAVGFFQFKKKRGNIEN